MKGYLFNSPLCGMNWTQKYRRVVDKIERVAGTPHAPRHRTQGLSTEKQRWGWKKPTDHNYVPVETNCLISQTFLQGSQCVYLDIHASNIQPKSLLPFQLSKGRQKIRESHQGSLLVQTVRRWTFPSTTQVIRCSEEKKEVSQKMWSRDHYIPHLPQRLDCFWLSWQVAAETWPYPWVETWLITHNINPMLGLSALQCMRIINQLAESSLNKGIDSLQSGLLISIM